MAVGTSIIIAVRNGSNFLVEAVKSALLQLDPTDEVLIVWDNSDDDTALIAKGFKDQRVREIKGPGRGVSGGRNAGLCGSVRRVYHFSRSRRFVAAWPSREDDANDDRRSSARCGVRTHAGSSRSRRHALAIDSRSRRASRSRAEPRNGAVSQPLRSTDWRNSMKACTSGKTWIIFAACRKSECGLRFATSMGSFTGGTRPTAPMISWPCRTRCSMSLGER